MMTEDQTRLREAIRFIRWQCGRNNGVADVAKIVCDAAESTISKPAPTMLEKMARAMADVAGAKSCGFTYEQVSVLYDEMVRAALDVLIKELNKP